MLNRKTNGSISLLLERPTNRTLRGVVIYHLMHSSETSLLGHDGTQIWKLTCVASLSLGLVSQGNAGTGVHDSGLLDDETVALQTGDVATGVRQGNFVGLVGIQPDFALSALQDGCREALLKTKIDTHG
mmetsp:Transcript_11016/g.26456  ORF Transcript_11016/g.26456 Transcript_11016/m.26456 type:complete len:129 (-) Transcript_11016:89-475(-)